MTAVTTDRDTAPRLTHDRTVPREIAHRRAVGEVFVTDSAPLGGDTFLLAWQIPRAHSLWGDRLVPYHDPFGVAEAARQASFVVVHRHLGVPLDVPFTLRRFAFRVLDGPRLFRDDRRHPLQGLLRYRVHRQQLTGDHLGRMSLDGVVEIDGLPAMSVGGDVVFLPRGDYEALRAFQRSRKPLAGVLPWTPAGPVAPGLVGRRDVRNVVVGEPEPSPSPRDPLRSPVIVDRSHPSFFDHDYDHVPGPFLVEGFRQAALLHATRSGALDSPVAAMTGLDTTFTDFGEFEAPLTYVADSVTATAGGVDVRVAVLQFGSALAEAVIGLTPYPPA